ncbi:dmX-like protein 2 isoform X2 [Halichondria panicea]|uniref:dmX-like protein 2 isoform X2 n=1 Tax=Halichondria panicea TaxID=6063 RepID=UPI00312B91E6
MVVLMRRNVVGVQRMAPHPTLAYYLTGCMDGSVVMWEFGNPRPVSTQILPGSGASVTMIRFTPEGNKYGVTDNSGKLSLWQGIHTAARKPYHSLYSGMKHLSDFLFLGSSSFIATCGDGSDNSLSMPFQKDFVIIQSNRMRKPQSSAFLSGSLSLSTFTYPSATSITHSQTGQSSSMVMRLYISTVTLPVNGH